ncbi:dynein light chain Tctex-type protein 2B-like [Babylonia areolata]|uniref:dynein light chain Tctex-type protein 2B-like n=1 Tax=Babylonia areolata TaxID=304850 RepID=UPI003FD3FBE4
MADTLRPREVSMSRRRTITRLTPGAPGRLKLSGVKEGSEAPDSSRPVHVKLENSYRMKPQDEERFQSWRVEGVMREVLEERLKGVTYDPVKSQELTKQLAQEIQKRVKDFRWQRYRVVCQITLGQQSQQGLQVASRCVWDHSLDSHASVTYDNKSIFVVAQCYGVYFE